MCVRLTKLIFKLAYQDSLQVGLIVAATLDKGGISFEGSTRVGISSRDSEAASITIPGFDRQTEGDLGWDWKSVPSIANKNSGCAILDQSLETVLKCFLY